MIKKKVLTQLFCKTILLSLLIVVLSTSVYSEFQSFNVTNYTIYETGSISFGQKVVATDSGVLSYDSMGKIQECFYNGTCVQRRSNFPASGGNGGWLYYGTDYVYQAWDSSDAKVRIFRTGLNHNFAQQVNTIILNENPDSYIRVIELASGEVAVAWTDRHTDNNGRLNLSICSHNLSSCDNKGELFPRQDRSYAPVGMIQHSNGNIIIQVDNESPQDDFGLVCDSNGENCVLTTLNGIASPNFQYDFMFEGIDGSIYTQDGGNIMRCDENFGSCIEIGDATGSNSHKGMELLDDNRIMLSQFEKVGDDSPVIQICSINMTGCSSINIDSLGGDSDERGQATLMDNGRIAFVYDVNDIAKLAITNVVLSEIVPELIFTNSTSENLSMKGTGQLPTPYIIESCNHLWSLNINISAYFILGNDIDCSGLNWNISFSDNIGGILDGRGYSIKNVLIDGENSYTSLSMFEGISDDSVVKNLWIENVTIKRASGGVGGNGVLFDSAITQYTIDNVHFRDINLTTNDTTSTSYVGAVVGFGDDCKIINNVSVENVHLEGSTYIGGIAGDIGDCYITQTYVKNLKVKYNGGSFLNNVGGIVGKGNSDTIINNTYVSGFEVDMNDATFIQNIGGLVGFYNGAKQIDSYVFNNSVNCSSFLNCGALGGVCGSTTTNYADIETILLYNDIGTNCPSSARKNITQMKDISTFTGFDFTNIWEIDNGTSPPQFQWDWNSSSQFLLMTNTPLTLSDFNITNPIPVIFPLLNLVYEYINGNWKIDYTITDDDNISDINVTLTDSSGQIYFNTSSDYFDIYLDSILFDNQNPINIDLWVRNIYGDIQTYSEVFRIDDSITPNCSLPINSIVDESISSTFNLVVNCQDESFDLINMTCEEYSHFNQSLNQKDLNLTDSFEVTMDNNCSVFYQDIFLNNQTSNFSIQFIPIPPAPSGNGTTIIVGNVFGEGSGSAIGQYNLMEMFALFIIIAVLCFMMSVGLWKKIPAVVFMTAIIFLFLGIFIQLMGLEMWVSIIGVGMIFWAVIMMAVSMGLAKA